jgi:nitrous oxide reductase accessory protein NosL
MSRFLYAVLVACLLAAGCDRPNEAQRARDTAARVLQGVLVYPQSSLVNVSAGDEAAEIVLSAPASMADVASWYRHALETNGWTVKSERVRNGVATLYAEQQQGRPLWITIRPNTGGPGATYTLVGAIPKDSTKAR